MTKPLRLLRTRGCASPTELAAGTLCTPATLRPFNVATASVVSRNWMVFRRQGFSPPARRERRAYPPAVCNGRATTREAKRPAARRVAPKMAWGFVGPRCQIAADMLPRRASLQAILGATKHQRIARHHTGRIGRASCGERG